MSWPTVLCVRSREALIRSTRGPVDPSTSDVTDQRYGPTNFLHTEIGIVPSTFYLLWLSTESSYPDAAIKVRSSNNLLSVLHSSCFRSISIIRIGILVTNFLCVLPFNCECDLSSRSRRRLASQLPLVISPKTSLYDGVAFTATIRVNLIAREEMP